MKDKIVKVRNIAAALLFIFSAAGCSSDNSENEHFSIILNQDTNTPIRGIHCEYYLSDKPIGGFEVLTRNGYYPGDDVHLTFEPAMFPDNDITDDFSAEIFVIDMSGKERKTENNIKISPEYGDGYRFVLTGNNSSYTLEYEQ